MLIGVAKVSDATRPQLGTSLHGYSSSCLLRRRCCAKGRGELNPTMRFFVQWLPWGAVRRGWKLSPFPNRGRCFGIYNLGDLSGGWPCLRGRLSRFFFSKQ
jgi:hypothetical protein